MDAIAECGPCVTDNGERRRLDDEFRTRREAEAAKEAHDAIHETERVALETAIGVSDRDRLAHNDAHDREHDHHTEKHTADREAIKVAMAAVDREREIHADAHAREHLAHEKEHSLSNLAITKAEKATDDRFAAANGYRDQITGLVSQMVTRDQLEVLIKEHDRRYEEQRAAIINLEKGDVGDRSMGRGRAIGQGVVIAAIIGTVSFAGTVLGIVIVIVNIATAA